MRAKVERLRNLVDKALDCFAVAVFLVVFAVVLLQVVMRYFFGSPLVWSEELARYLFVWISFMGWIFATRSGTHIRIGAFVDMLKGPARKLVVGFNFVLTVAFAVVMGYYGYHMVLKNLDIPTVTLFFTYAVVYAAVPFSSVLIILYSTLRLLEGEEDKGGTAS